MVLLIKLVHYYVDQLRASCSSYQLQYSIKLKLGYICIYIFLCFVNVKCMSDMINKSTIPPSHI